jgi:fructokinase
LRLRWSCPGEELPAGHPGWDLETRYLALGLASFICTLSPRLILVGGGVARRLDFARLCAEVRALLNGYLREPEICPPALTGDAGVLGALALGGEALERAGARG